ncbi:MAG: formate/nitrite transporter family protein [Chitinophagaceae bacterium]
MKHEADMLMPPEMAEMAEASGVRKAGLPVSQLLVLSILAGAFIALGAAFSQVVLTGNEGLWGITRLLGGLAFSIGLVLVIFSGAELFTGNNLLVMAFAAKKITFRQLLRNWVWVFLGNSLGALFIALLVLLSQYANMNHAQVAQTILQQAANKCALSSMSAFFLGTLCNVLVCLAVWMSYSALDAGGKLWTIIFPVTAFVACGFEHVIANLYIFPLAYGLIHFPALTPGIEAVLPTYMSSISFMGMMHNLFFVLLGNLFGGVFLVGLVYWFVYLRPTKQTE